MKNYAEDRGYLDDDGRMIFHKRATVLPLLAWAIIIGLALGIALWPVWSRADDVSMIAKDEKGNTVRLFTDPCAAAASWMKMRRAEMRFEGKDYGACWIATGGHVLVFDDNGDLSVIPQQAFQRESRV